MASVIKPFPKTAEYIYKNRLSYTSPKDFENNNSSRLNEQVVF